MTLLFADGFETGDFSAWSGEVDEAQADVAVSAGAAKAGTYGLAASLAQAGGDQDDGYVHKFIAAPASNIIRVELWARFTAYTNGGFAIPATYSLFSLWNNWGAPDPAARNCWIQVSPDLAPGVKLAYQPKSDSPFSSAGTNVGAALAMPLGTWFLLRLTLDRSGANPIVTLDYSTDGVSFTQHATVTDVSSGSEGVGATPTYYLAGAVNNRSTSSGTWAVEIDSVAVYDDVASIGGPTFLPAWARHSNQLLGAMAA